MYTSFPQPASRSLHRFYRRRRAVALARAGLAFAAVATVPLDTEHAVPGGPTVTPWRTVATHPTGPAHPAS